MKDGSVYLEYLCLIFISPICLLKAMNLAYEHQKKFPVCNGWNPRMVFTFQQQDWAKSQSFPPVLKICPESLGDHPQQSLEASEDVAR